MEAAPGQLGQAPSASGSGGQVGAGGGGKEKNSSEPLPPPAMIPFLSACFAELRAKGMMWGRKNGENEMNDSTHHFWGVFFRNNAWVHFLKDAVIFTMRK